MPRNMTNVPRLPMFLIIVSFECMFALLATIFVLRKYDQEQKALMSTNKQDTNDDTTFSKIEETSQDVEPTMATSGNSHFISYFNYIFDKMSLSNSRVMPFDKVQKSEKRSKAQRKHRTCSIRSSTWDMIFFWLFHTVTIPTFYLLFRA